MPPKAAKGKLPAPKVTGSSKRKVQAEPGDDANHSLNQPTSAKTNGTARKLTAAERWVETTKPSLGDALAAARSEALAEERITKRAKVGGDTGAATSAGPANSFGAAVDLDSLKHYAKLGQTSLQGMTEKLDLLWDQVQDIAATATQTKHRVGHGNDMQDRFWKQLNSLVNDVDEVSKTVDGISASVDEIDTAVANMDDTVNVLQEKLGELDDKVDAVDTSVENVSYQVESVGNKVEEMDETVNAINAGVENNTSLITSLFHVLVDRIDGLSEMVRKKPAAQIIVHGQQWQA